jgi:hypothetical protein
MGCSCEACHLVQMSCGNRVYVWSVGSHSICSVVVLWLNCDDRRLSGLCVLRCVCVVYHVWISDELICVFGNMCELLIASMYLKVLWWRYPVEHSRCVRLDCEGKDTEIALNRLSIRLVHTVFYECRVGGFVSECVDHWLSVCSSVKWRMVLERMVNYLDESVWMGLFNDFPTESG